MSKRPDNYVVRVKFENHDDEFKTLVRSEQGLNDALYRGEMRAKLAHPNSTVDRVDAIKLHEWGQI